MAPSWHIQLGLTDSAAIDNIQNILVAAGSSLELVIKTTVYLRDIQDFGAMNGIYATFFPSNPPARSTVQVAALPRGVAIEIDTVAIVAQ